jgi:formate hydrogenlyase subunit 5
MSPAAPPPTVALEPEALPAAVAEATGAGQGGRFAGLVASAGHGSGTLLRALVAAGKDLRVLEARVAAGVESYPALTPLVPAAFWYEREIHDLFGLVAEGHPRLDPLVLPLAPRPGTPRPRPGRPDGPEKVELEATGLPGHVAGEGIFTLPYGPVRSGVFEAVEYVIETFGEDVSHLRVRPYLKHRGISRRFTGMAPEDGVLLAERVEGTAAVAHATAFCEALEAIAGVAAPMPAQLVRALHAELERIANHLDSVIRHTEGAGLAVAFARMTLHKERLLRLVARLCGHRFGKGVVVPGGVHGPPLLQPETALAELADIEEDFAADAALLMRTPSFLDRLQHTGVLPREIAADHGLLGPVGRGSGAGEDVRASRPYGAYAELGFEAVEARPEGDALARQWIRLEEISASFRLARRALGKLADLDAKDNRGWRTGLPVLDGTGLGWAESPQGELLYVVDLAGGRISSARPRCASFHNFALFSRAFNGDIFTDFVFIEASFGLSIAGVAG